MPHVSSTWWQISYIYLLFLFTLLMVHGCNQSTGFCLVLKTKGTHPRWRMTILRTHQVCKPLFCNPAPSGKPSSQLQKHQTQEKEVLDNRLIACNETEFSVYATAPSTQQIHTPEHFLFMERHVSLPKEKPELQPPRLTWLLSLSTFLKHLFKDKLCLTEFFHPVGAFAKYGKCSKIQL